VTLTRLAPALRLAVSLTISLIINSGCILIPVLEFHNNTSSSVTVCNPGLAKDGCVTTKAYRAARLSLRTDHTVGASLFNISREGITSEYNFGSSHLWTLCRDPGSLFCAVVVRLDSNGLVYWVNAVDSSVYQPAGFPVSPSP
jgi:hypothetical protein